MRRMANLRYCSFFLTLLSTFIIINVFLCPIQGKSIESSKSLYQHHHKRSVVPVIADLPSKASVEDPQVKKYAQQGVDKLSESSTGPKSILEKILEATFFPPAGKLLYEIKIKVKSEESEESKDDSKECTVNVWRESDSDPSVTVECGKTERKRRATEEEPAIGDVYIADYPMELDVTDPQIKTYAQQGLKEYAKKSPESKAVLVQILKAHYVPLSIYSHSIQVKFGKKTCLETEDNNCENDELETEICTIYIPNAIEKEINIKCDEDKKKKREAEEAPKESTTGRTFRNAQPLKVFPDQPPVQKFAQKGVELYAESSTGPNEPILEKIEEALLYPPTGKTLFEIKIKIGTSTCAKGQKENCELKADGESKSCTVHVYIENHKSNVELLNCH